MFKTGVATIAVILGFVPVAFALDADRIGEIVGTKASETADHVVRVTWGRSDVNVTVDGVPMAPFAGVTSWAAFKESGAGAVVMGDTVVFQDEANPAIDAAFANGLTVTALHNHFFYDDPPVFFMHIGGEGTPESLARGVRATWDAVKAVRAKSPEPAAGFAGPTPSPSSVTVEPLQKILGTKPAVNGGMAKFSMPRDGSMAGVPVGGSMGLSTWAAFTGSDELALVDGDFIMTAGEVQPVLHALRAAGINIVSLHNHMIGESPSFYFTHFLGKGKASDLAAGLKSALDAQRAVSD